MSEIIMIIIGFFVGALMIKMGIDNSNSTKLSKEILAELREIKEILHEGKNKV